MLFLEFAGMVVLYWQAIYQVFFVQEQLGVAQKDIQRVISFAGSISTIGTILLGLAMGLIYDTFGRKMPTLIFLLICVLAEVSFSFLTNESEFYMAIIFLMPL